MKKIPYFRSNEERNSLFENKSSAIDKLRKKKKHKRVERAQPEETF
jgi:hypothetical protein